MEPQAIDSPRCVAPNWQFRDGNGFLVTKSGDTAAASSSRRLCCAMFLRDPELFCLFGRKDLKHVCRPSPPRNPRLNSGGLSWSSLVAERGQIARLVRIMSPCLPIGQLTYSRLD